MILRPRYPNVPGQPDRSYPDLFIAHAATRVRSEWRTASVVHGHYSVQALAARRISKRTGLPYVVTFHGSDLNTWPDEHPRRSGDLQEAVRGASQVLAVSPALVDRLEHLTGVSALHLPVGCDLMALTLMRMSRREARVRLSLRDDTVIALFVGLLDPTKGTREFVESVLRLGPSFAAILVGDGPDMGYGLADGRAGERITYVGRRQNEEVMAFMSAADMLVLPSYAEGTPTVIVEAGAMGLPVVASAVGGIPELLGSDRGFMLPEISASAVADAIVEIAERPLDARDRADRLAAHVREFHDADRNAGRLAEIYRSIAG
jgi:teichuronic acid biosynthesis glycosyltransferase TuaC